MWVEKSSKSRYTYILLEFLNRAKSVDILLMVQKSGSTHQVRLVIYPPLYTQVVGTKPQLQL